MNIEDSALKIAIWIDTYNEKHEISVNKMKCILVLYIHNLVILTSAFAIGWLLGELKEVMLAAAGIAALRMVSGGRHAKTLEWCAVITTSILVCIPLIPMNHLVTNIFTGISLVLVLIFAPMNIDESFLQSKWSPYLKIASAIMVASNFIFPSEILAVAFLIQSISLIGRR